MLNVACSTEYFPLTLTLSLREREPRIPRCQQSSRVGLSKTRRTFLPLPRGEGRGEGETSVFHPTV